MDDLYVLIGFDVEHDAEPFSQTCEGVQTGLPLILDILDSLDIHCTFNILASIIDDHVDLFKRVQHQGHELGCHSFDHEALSFMENEDMYVQVQRATVDIEKKLGKRPITFRAPYLLGNTFLINMLEEFHYLIDSSYPLAHYKTQVVPYHPSGSNWIKKGDLHLMELPVSADPSINEPEHSDLWPLWRTIGAKDTMRKIEHLLKKQQSYSPKGVVTFYLHPWEFIELGDLGLGIPEDHQEQILKGTGTKAVANFKELLGWLQKQKHATFLPMCEFRPVWEEQP
jgi:peptidoglycan/xylan/chitin deacetylase (PgdA/CDA1 family)